MIISLFLWEVSSPACVSDKIICPSPVYLSEIFMYRTDHKMKQLPLNTPVLCGAMQPDTLLEDAYVFSSFFFFMCLLVALSISCRVTDHCDQLVSSSQFRTIP